MKIEKTVYLIRHGQSEDNVREVFQSPESPLTKKGEKQAKNIAKRISKLSLIYLFLVLLNAQNKQRK
jgi:Fructose-2,6-bisphosphatase